MGNEAEIFEKLGNIAGTLEEVKGILVRTEERNDKEHEELRAEIQLRALKCDVDNLGEKMRRYDKRFDLLENKGDKNIANTVKSIGKYVGVFLGSAVFLFFIMNLPNFVKFLQDMASKK